jgi:Tol biopolymer transport system component/predicted Ser/Thr protein kinase
VWTFAVMNPERLRQIEELYHSACEREPAQREGFLVEACDGDAELLARLQALLAERSGDGPLERPILELAAKLLCDAPTEEWTSGTQVGPYRIQAVVGEGGMAKVFKALDTRLGREVALKVAREEFSGRFQREARAISALNHGNVCTLYDVGSNFLVMEFVEGRCLSGPVPVDVAIDYARQLAAGLEAAHKRGIVHRDLKPANIKVTPDGIVKILDFGLAKAIDGRVGESYASADLPVSLEGTKSGILLGTPAYMSPEQVRGEPVDRRTDIWAFGVIFYEILTGKRPFGDCRDISSTLAASLTRAPDLGLLPPEAPMRVKRLLAHCLEKDPDKRLHDIADVRILLDESELEPGVPPFGRGALRWGWAVGLASLALIALVGRDAWRTLNPARQESFQRIRITKLTDTGNVTAAAISPDGKYVIHAVTSQGNTSLWIRHTSTGSNVQIAPPVKGTLSNLNFSRDGNSLTYVLETDGSIPAIYTIPVLGGSPRILAAFPRAPVASLSPDEKRVVFATSSTSENNLIIANLDGGAERKVATRRSPDHLVRSAWSPDGRNLAYTVFSQRGGVNTALFVIPVDGASAEWRCSRTWYNIGSLRWLPDGHGFILTANEQFPFFQIWYVPYPRGQTRALTNDLSTYRGLSLTADASSLVAIQTETISHLWSVEAGDPGSAHQITTGRLDGLNWTDWSLNGPIYFEAPDSRGNTQVWATSTGGLDRRQITTGQLTGQPSSCGANLHLLFASFQEGNPHIWSSDLNGGNLRRLTAGESEGAPSCSRDGSWLTYTSNSAMSEGVWRMPLAGGEPTRIWNRPARSWISPDGKSVLLREPLSSGGRAFIVPANGGTPIRSFERTADFGDSPQLAWSSDGLGILFLKTSAGVSNIWRRPLDGGEPRQLTSFTSQRITSFAVDPGSRRLVLARGTISSDVVLISNQK